jgi:hypothetical protein
MRRAETFLHIIEDPGKLDEAKVKETRKLESRMMRQVSSPVRRRAGRKGRKNGPRSQPICSGPQSSGGWPANKGTCRPTLGLLATFGDSRKRNSPGTQRHAMGSGHTLLCGNSPHTGLTDALPAWLPRAASPALARSPVRGLREHTSPHLVQDTAYAAMSCGAAGSREPAAWACLSRGTRKKRRPRRSRCARPNMWRFSIFKRLM